MFGCGAGTVVRIRHTGYNQQPDVWKAPDTIMPFSATEHIVFEKNTLTGVTCQLSYPPILKIAQEVPSAFQDAVRSDYPLFETRPTLTIVAPPVPGQPVTQTVTNAYIFSTAESPQPQRTLSLAQDSLALTTTAYTRRSEFLTHLQPPLDALQAIYQPAFFTRVGFRYQNMIVRSALGLGDTPWRELLKPVFVGLASAEELAGQVLVDYAQIQYKSENGNVVLQHGVTVDPATQEQCYLIDVDVSTQERVRLQDATEKLRALNIDALQLYHWCLSDTLKAALNPRHVA